MAEGWTFPVAGANEWGGSYMPNTINHRGRTHPAIDIYAERGTAIVAPVSGVVMSIGVNSAIGGNWVQMRGDDGIVYYFAHMDTPPPVSKGQRVTNQSYLGAVGDTGSAKGTKPHLHFKMTYGGKPVDPRQWFKNGAQANPDNYTFSYNDPRGTMQGDVWFQGEQATQPKDDPIRQNIMAMLDTISSSVAGGTRQAGMGEEIVDMVQNPETEVMP